MAYDYATGKIIKKAERFAVDSKNTGLDADYYIDYTVGQLVKMKGGKVD